MSVELENIASRLKAAFLYAKLAQHQNRWPLIAKTAALDEYSRILREYQRCLVHERSKPHAILSRLKESP